MSQLKAFLLDLTTRRDLREEFHKNSGEFRADIYERYGLTDDQIAAIDRGLEVWYEFKADLDEQVADPDVVVKLKVPPICPPPIW